MTKAAVMVVTFANSTANISHIPSNTTLVKQYGRRLVLDFIDYHCDAADELKHLEQKLLQEYATINPEWVVLDVEKDLPLNIMVIETPNNNDTFQQQNLFNQNQDILNEQFGNTVEWQYANSEPYSTHAESAWRMGILSHPSVIVAVIDSGLSSVAIQRGVFRHLVPGYDFISNVQYSLDGDGRDPDWMDPSAVEDCGGGTSSDHKWHGTKMSSLLASAHNILPGFHSMAPHCGLQMVRVLGKCGVGFANDLSDAIVWASGGFIGGGVGYNKHPAQIISLSIAGKGQCPSYLQSAINLAVLQQDVLIITAAGNYDGESSEDYFPANCKHVLVVGASTRSGEKAAYSNYDKSNSSGSLGFLLAPGGDASDPIQVISVLQTPFVYNDSSKNGSYYTLSKSQIVLTKAAGTSLSVVLASGMAALYFQLTGNLFLRNSTVPVGGGLIHAKLLLQAATQCRSSSSFVQQFCGAGILNFSMMDEEWIINSATNLKTLMTMANLSQNLYYYDGNHTSGELTFLPTTIIDCSLSYGSTAFYYEGVCGGSTSNCPSFSTRDPIDMQCSCNSGYFAQNIPIFTRQITISNIASPPTDFQVLWI